MPDTLYDALEGLAQKWDAQADELLAARERGKNREAWMGVVGLRCREHAEQLRAAISEHKNTVELEVSLRP